MKKHVKTIYNKSKDILVSVIIPCAGLGRRMKSYGCKSLLLVNGLTIIERQIRNIENQIPNVEFTIISGFDSDRLHKSTPETFIKVENERYYETNVVRSIGIGLRTIKNNDHVLIVFGDIVFNEEVLSLIDYDRSCILLSEKMSDQEVGCNLDTKNNVLYMMFDLPNKWGHIMYLTGKELKMFKDFVFNKSNEKKFCFEIINEIIDRGGKIKGINIDKKSVILDIDNSRDLKIAGDLIK